MFATGARAQGAFIPARFTSGSLPPLPAMAVGGGEVLLDVTVGVDGRVASVTPLRTTPPFADMLAAAVRSWQFSPATDIVRRNGGPPVSAPVESHVLVAGIFLPPALLSPTLGELPKDVGVPVADVAFPSAIVQPPLPPQARSPGVTMLEARVDAAGAVSGIRAVQPAPPYDSATETALRNWQFRPARVDGAAVSSFVYIVAGFPLPVVQPRR
jgi:hypothetical protein